MDEIDSKIISYLQENGRATLKELGEAIGFTSMGIKKRMDRLLGDRMIKVSASINLERLDLYAALIFLEIKDGETRRAILERFKQCPRIIHIFSSLSGYNLIVLTMAEDRDTLESEFMEKCSLRNQEGVRRSELYPISNIGYEPFLHVRQYLAHKEKTNAPCKVNCGSCRRYQSHKCIGCPATIYYRDPYKRFHNKNRLGGIKIEKVSNTN